MLPFPGSKRSDKTNAIPPAAPGDVFGCELVQFDKEKINIFAARMQGCGPHWHSAPEFIVVLDGSFTVIVNAVPTDLGRGGMIYINGDEIHSLEAPGDGGALFTIQFSPELFIQAEGMRIGYLVPAADRYRPEDADIHRMVATLLADSVDAGLADPFHRMASIYGLLSALRGAGTVSPLPDRGQPRRDDEMLVKDCMEHINRHYGEDLGLTELARRACVSYHHFSKMFKRYSGYNFKDYLNQVRVSKARHLLKNTRTPITEICFACGFSEHKHFISVFRKYHDMTPTEFRKKCLLAANLDGHRSPPVGLRQLPLTRDLLERAGAGGLTVAAR